MTAAKEQAPLSAFISYRRGSPGDTDLVRLLSEKLKQSNIMVFWDDLEAEAERPPDWDKRVFEAIQESRVVIPILSPRYLTSSTARGELLLALEEDKPVVPVLSEQCEIPKALHNTPYIDATAWTPGDETCLSRIVSEISFNIYSPPSYPGTPRKTILFSQAERTLNVDNHGVLSWKLLGLLDREEGRARTTENSRLARAATAMKSWHVTSPVPLQIPIPYRTLKPLVAGLAGISSLTAPFQSLLTRPVPEADQETHTALASTGAAVREYVRVAFDHLKEEIAEKDE